MKKNKNVFMKEIGEFFKKNSLDIEGSNQFLSRKKKDQVIELKELGIIYATFHPLHGHHSCSCQNRINDLVTFLQLFVKEDKKAKELIKFKKMKIEDLRKFANERGIKTDDTSTEEQVIYELQK